MTLTERGVLTWSRFSFSMASYERNATKSKDVNHGDLDNFQHETREALLTTEPTRFKNFDTDLQYISIFALRAMEPSKAAFHETWSRASTRAAELL